MNKITMSKTISELYRDLEQEGDSAVVDTEDVIINPVLDANDFIHSMPMCKSHPTLMLNDNSQIDDDNVEVGNHHLVVPKSALQVVVNGKKRSRSLRVPPNLLFNSKQNSVELLKQLQDKMKEYKTYMPPAIKPKFIK